MNQDLNKGLIYNTQYLFGDYLNNFGSQFFNIPEYQRGYKWTKDNIIQLLEDIDHYQESTDSFYCLQNITIIPAKVNGEECFNVIDGQQRLTTLLILVSYLQKDDKIKILSPSSNILRYSIRKDTDKFLKEKVVSGDIWREEIVPNNALHKDEYYICQACAAIDEWFKENNHLNGEFLNNFKNKVLNDVVLIVNKLEGSNEENVFANLNGGKVDLDGSDLLRAILITKAANEKYPSSESNYNFRTPLVNIEITEGPSSRINEYRIRLGMELDSIAALWSKKDVKAFYSQILPNDISKNKRFQCSKYPIGLLYLAFFEAYKNVIDYKRETNISNVDIRFFENGIDLNHKVGDDHYELYTTILKLHRTLKEWFNDPEIYNLLGYLFFNFKGKDNVTFSEVWKLWNDCSCKDKDTFKKRLKVIIHNQILSLFEGNSGDEESDDDNKTAEHVLKEKIEDVHHNWFKEESLYAILVLMDIILTMSKNSFNRLPVNYFKAYDEHKEHIRPQTANEEDTTETEDYHGCLNSIGNLVLLDGSINESIGNNLYEDKVQRIVNAYFRENKFIRPYTFSVYLTKLDDKGKMELGWTDDEIQDTANKIYERIATFLDFGKENTSKD